MLEKMLDLKNTFEGKFLAVLMSVVLVMSMTNILAFAGNEGQKDGSKTESAPTDQVVGESDKEAVDEAVQHGESAAAKDADASKTTPSQPLVSTTVDEAVVTFETQNAFVSVKNQLLSGTMLTTELHKELRFTASADTGFELGAITAKNAANADVPVTTQDGVSSIAAEYVDSTLVVSVVAAAVVSDEPEVETTPITSDTKIEPGEADEKGEPEEPKSEEPETDEPEAPVADEDVVEVEADVSNPAFEGYAQAGNVLVKVTAAEGVLPEGATVQATRIERQDVVDAVAERVESQGKVLEDAIAIDVTLLDKDGNEIQPNGALNVCFFDANVEGEEVGVYRVSDDASQVETIGARQADPAVQSFDVDHFTIYVATGSNYASTGIKLDSSSIEVGEKIQARGEWKTVWRDFTWTSSDTSVAKVSAVNGHPNWADITGVNPGTATITYSYKKVNGQKITDIAEVHVVPSVVKHTVSWYVNGDVSKSTKVRDGEVPSYGGTPNRAGDWQHKQFVGWATAPNSKNYLTEGELPAVTEDVSYYAVFTSQAYFYFVLEGRSNTSTVAKDYMYAGEGTMIIPDGFNSGDRWYDGSSFSIADYIVSTPSDEAIRNGIRAAYADYSPDWTYTIDWTTLSVAGSSVDYWYNTFDYGKSMHTDGALSINKDTTIGVTYLTQKPDGSVVTNSTSHDKNVAFGLNSTVNTDALSFETDGYTYDSRVRYNGASYVFDGWYLDQSYTTKAPDSVSLSSSASFYARYIANTKILTYQANGGAFSDGTTQDKTAVQQVDARVSFISNPSRDGYVFTGWKDKDTGDVYSAGVSGMTMPDRDVTLVAQWQGVIPIKLLGDEVKKTYSGTKQSHTGFTVSGLDMGSYTVFGVQALAQGTDVGTYKGTIDYSGMRIVEKSSGSDVTNQFEVVEASEPTLIVEKAPISIVTPNDSKLYDGAPLIATEGAELSGLVNDETATLIVAGSRTDAGVSDNAYRIDWSGSAKESNYFIDEETIGALEILPRPITVTANGGEKQYDGKPLTAAETGYAIGGEGLVEGHEADVALSGSRTAPGTADATVASVAVKDGTADVTSNYDVTTANGTLTVTSRDAKYEVTLKANSSTGNVYDGAEKSAKGVEADRFVIDGVEYAVSGYLTQDPAETAAGTYTNNVTGDFKVEDPAGNNVTSEFAVHTEDGALEILPREVTLASGSATKIYDGTALELPDVTVGGDGFVGTEASVRATGSITDIGGPIDNTIVVEPGEGFIAANYNVVYTVGKLTVTSASIDPDDPSYTGIQINNPYDVQYNGQEQKWVPSVFDRNNHKLVAGADYTVSYSQDVRNVGVVTVTITGVGNYVGTVERAYNITPAPAVIRVNDSSKAYGETDPAFTGAVEGLFGDDLLGDIAYSRTNADEEVGNYSDVLTATVGNLNGNYTYTVEPGNFSIVPAGGNVVTIDATGLTKTYDGQPVSVVAEASVDGSALLYSVDGSTWSDVNPEFTNAGTYTVYVKATHDGYEESAPVSATVVINPAPVTIAVADASKVAGVDDPAFSGTVEGLVAEGDLGDINYVRPGSEEAAGVYVGALTALYTQNGNYEVTVLNGTFTITAAPVTPPTPPTPPTSPTPTPLPTPGTVPPDSPIAPVVTPIVDALQGAAEAVIGDNETPLAEPRETEIGDNDTPLASHDHASCWVHWYIILGIIVTALYGACVALRRGLFSRKLKKYEDGLTGGGDPAPGAPSISDDASAPIAPKGAPAGATLAAGLGE
ncbi:MULTISPECIES: MBG domain-containing protein [Eggerthella]|uniref:Cell wall-binding protein n=3 Tax=Eggerthella TaxID=84111 RepID=A0A369MRA8_EGGLN|nr:MULTISPECIES: MBG domain-containing protein [Eggerthella]MBU5400425.1 InlB B-repeat-containing protein [Eggerthella lenta]MCQ5105500.1 InlB B-repeat-containing protein [Eggerthella lenta]MDB1745964.1 MBG domain-containing protein [Eggerthella lenta]MDB1768374.1 MBG domain-containing protein [Eggerthella lenta]MDB1774126.1 MBG domain-containing protein [Eggerthella lenta]